MKKLLFVITGLTISIISWSQDLFQGSIQQGSASNKVDIVFMPNHNSTAGEFVNFLQIAIAVPAASASGLVLGPSSIVGVGNFAGMSFSTGVAGGVGYTNGTDRVYSFIYLSGASSTQSWTLGNSFVGLTITFSGPTQAQSSVRLVDFTQQGGGGDGQTFFTLQTSRPNDATPLSNFFFPIGGANGSTEGTYPSGDEYVETTLLVTLPVNLLNFSGYKSSSKNVLRWSTASEQNSQGFEVQRSTDGINYSSIGFVNSVASGGGSSSQLNYTFDDNNPVGKKQYYRLKQVDLNGRNKLSNIVMIKGDKPLSLSIGGLFPNPARSLVNVIIDAPNRDKVTLIVTDINGKTVKQQMANVDIGSNTIPVEISKLAQGSYLVKVVCKSDCETAVAQFNKQ